MRRLPLAIAAASTLVAAALPATASATEVQIGQTTTPVAAPTCPNGQANADCTIVLYKMTALETLSDGAKLPTKVTQDGVISSYTVGISGITSDQSTLNSIVASENKEWGGAASVAITVLRPMGSSNGITTYQVAAESPVQPIRSYFGSVVQFPLAQALPVVPGEVVALTSPTWAPVLTIDLSTTNFGYIQSRTGNCTNNSKKPAYLSPQLEIGNQAAYGCGYTGTRVEYTATETTTPSATAAYRLASKRLPARKPRRLR